MTLPYSSFESYVYENAGNAERGFDIWWSGLSPSQDPKETTNVAFVFIHKDLCNYNLRESREVIFFFTAHKGWLNKKKVMILYAEQQEETIDCLKKKKKRILCFLWVTSVTALFKLNSRRFCPARRKHLVVCLFPLKGMFTFMRCCAL